MKFKALWLLLPLFVLTILAMSGCGTTTTVTTTATTTKTVTDTSAVDVVKKFIAAEDKMFSTGDGSGLMEVEDPTIVIHMMAFPDTKGSAAHVAAIKGIVAGNPGITHTWSEVIGMGDIGVCRWVEKLKIGDKDVEYQGSYFLKIKDGKIIEAWLISDMLTYFLAAGVVQYAPQQVKTLL